MLMQLDITVHEIINRMKQMTQNTVCNIDELKQITSTITLPEDIKFLH